MMTVDDVSTADLYDELGDTVDSCSVQFVQYGAKTRFSGEIRTIRCFRDNALVKETLNSPGNGRVLVVDGGASLESALLGDLIGEAALKNGWSGVIINGAVRDSQALATLDIGIKALGTNPRKSAKEGAGERDVAVTFGNATFHPGDHVWSDEDGILVTARVSAADPSA